MTKHPLTIEAEAPKTDSPLTMEGTINVAAAAEGDGENKLPTFEMTAYNGGLMKVAGWYLPVVVNLAGLTVATQNRPIRFNHNASISIGHTTEINVSGGKITAKGIISGTGQTAREIVGNAKNGFPYQASIGAKVGKVSELKAGEKSTINGKQITGPAFIAESASLGEISIVDLGADDTTSTKIAANAKQQTAPDKEQNAMNRRLRRYLASIGLPIGDITAANSMEDLRLYTDTMTDDQRDIAAQLGEIADDAEIPAALSARLGDNAVDDKNSGQAQGNINAQQSPGDDSGLDVRAEIARVDSINTLSASWGQRIARASMTRSKREELVAKVEKMRSDAIDAGKSSDDLELEFHRQVDVSANAAPVGFAINAASLDTGKMLEATLLRASGFSDDDIAKDRN